MPIIKEISDENPDSEINVAALVFSNATRWLYSKPKSAAEFVWQDVNAGGLTSLGAACLELNDKLSRSHGFMKSASGSYAPAIILLSGSGPTDNFQAGLDKLRTNSWFKNAIKVAIAIGEDADKNVLKEFCGNIGAVLTVHNIEALEQIIRVAVDDNAPRITWGAHTAIDRNVRVVKVGN